MADEMAHRIQKNEELIKQTSDDKARKILGLAIQRFAAQHTAAEFELSDVTREDGELRFSADEELLERFMITLGKRRIGVRALIPQQATLEQLFFQLTEQDGAPAAAPPTEPADPVVEEVA